MAKKKIKKKPVEAEAITEAAPAETQSTEPTASVSKADAVRAALKEGVEKPQEASAWIKEKFGIEIAPQVFSSYKSQQTKKTEGSSNHGAAVPKSGSISIEAAEQVRDLVKQHGAETVKKLAEFFR